MMFASRHFLLGVRFNEFARSHSVTHDTADNLFLDHGVNKKFKSIIKISLVKIIFKTSPVLPQGLFGSLIQ